MKTEMNPRQKSAARGESHIRAVNRAEPHERGDRGGDRDDQRRHGEQHRRERIHPADEHVVAPNHVAQEADGDHAADHHAHSAEQRLASEGRQNVGNDADGGKDRDVHLRMAEEPEQVLPEKRRASGMRLQRVADDQAGRDEEAGAGDAIEDEKNARGKKDPRRRASRCRR